MGAKMKIEAKLVSNIVKIIVSVIVLIFNIVYIVLNKQIALIDQQLSLLVAITWSVWLPIDASIFVKNLKKIKDITK